MHEEILRKLTGHTASVSMRAAIQVSELRGSLPFMQTRVFLNKCGFANTMACECHTPVSSAFEHGFLLSTIQGLSSPTASLALQAAEQEPRTTCMCRHLSIEANQLPLLIKTILVRLFIIRSKGILTHL